MNDTSMPPSSCDAYFFTNKYGTEYVHDHWPGDVMTNNDIIKYFETTYGSGAMRLWTFSSREVKL